MITAMLAVWGLCLGSFAAATVWRMHHKRDWVRERSECEHCHHVLAWYDLVPILSWLMLRGTCRYCHKKLSAEYLVTELAGAALFAGLYAFWPRTLEGWEFVRLGVWLALVTGFIMLSLFDLKWFLLPDKVVYPLLILVVAERAVFAILNTDANIIRETVLGIAIGGGIFWALFQVSDGKWIGGGDVKLGFLIGAAVGGPLKAVLVLFFASCIGSLYGVSMMLVRRIKRSSHIPFGPFLMSAAYVVFLLGDKVVHWYNNLFLL